MATTHTGRMKDNGPVRRDAAALVFPTLTGRTLLGSEVVLPQDLPAARNLVVVAFQRWQQSVVDSWIALAVEAGVPKTTLGVPGPHDVAVVEVPVLGMQWRMMRGFIDGGMTSGIRDPEILARTITVYTDVGSVQRALAIQSTDKVEALIVQQDGTVLARSNSHPDEASWSALAGAMLS